MLALVRSVITNIFFLSSRKSLTFVIVYLGVRNFVQDLNPTQLATIDTEFEKVADQAPPQPTKSSVSFTNILAKSQFCKRLESLHCFASNITVGQCISYIFYKRVSYADRNLIYCYFIQ